MSDSESSNGSARVSDMDENSESDGEESTDSTDIDVDPFDTAEEYRRLLDEIRSQEYVYGITLYKRGLPFLILENVDDFIGSMASISEIEHMTIGDPDGDSDRAKGPPLEISEEHEAAWSKLLTAFSNVANIGRLVIGGFNLSGKAMASILHAMRQCGTIVLHLPSHKNGGIEMGPIIDELNSLSCLDMIVCLNGASGRGTDSKIGTLSQLFGVHRLSGLDFADIDFALDECVALSSALSSDMCNVKKLWLSDCAFLDGGGERVGASIGTNKCFLGADYS